MANKFIGRMHQQKKVRYNCVNKFLFKKYRFSEPKARPPPSHHRDTDERPSCQWGSKCRDIGDRQHRENYSHLTPDQDKDARPESGHRQYPCQYGSKCYDHTDRHRAKYSHPSGEEKDKHTKDQRTPCKYGLQCRSIGDADHRGKYSHPKAS